MDWQDAWGMTHVAAALTALIAGYVVLRSRKGTRAHRVTGTAYGVALVLVDGAAFFVHRQDTFGVFHGLAVISLGTLAAGLAPLIMGVRSPAVVASHAYFMTWSYAGLVAAGCGQLAAALGGAWSPWVVPVVIATVLGVSGVVISTRVPRALSRVMAG